MQFVGVFSFVWSTQPTPTIPCWSTTFKSSSESREKEDRGNSLVSEMVKLAQSEVYTHQNCNVALKGAAIDVECSFTPDGPSLVAVFVQVVLHVQIFRA